MSEKKSFFGRLFKKGEKEDQAIAPETASEDQLDAKQEAEEPTVPAIAAAEPTVPQPDDRAPEDSADLLNDPDESERPALKAETDTTDTTETPDTADRNDIASEPAPAPQPQKKQGFFTRLTQGLSKSSTKLTTGVSTIFAKRKLDDETLEELEDLLITADLGTTAAAQITTALAKDKFDKEISGEEVRAALAEHVARSLTPLEMPIALDSSHKPHVILMTGVNGAGKTTTIGKLARKFRDEGKSVMLVAGDTFRAAAIEQLTVWGERVGAPVISREIGADAAGLAFDAIKEAQSQNIDVLMIDTAGRLQNRTELMDELAKIVRVIRKLDETAPHDTILVLDATVGQNAISQAQAFTEIAGVSGLIMTKLDGTAKGGVLVALADKFALPIHYVGVGEDVEDLQPFSADQFTKALTGLSSLTEAA